MIGTSAIVRKKLVESIKFEGLENLDKISADSYLRVEAICTEKTSAR